MRILITGGAGFIGSHLCERFIAEGHEVTCVDNFITGTERNLSAVQGTPAFRLIRHDISRPLEVDGKVDFMLHFASPASPPDFFRYPIQIMKVGSLGTLNTLGIAKAKRAKFLLASTSEVYGDPDVHPQREDYWGHVNPVGPRGVYDEAKRFSEALTMAYHREHEIDTRIIRIFNSILADETVILFNEHKLHLEPIADYVAGLERRLELDPPKILVPSFDPQSCRVSLAEVSAVIKHLCRTECFQIHLRYGRSVKVTGDHSVFTCDENGMPSATPVRQLQVGDYVAIPALLPAVEKDVERFHLGDLLVRDSTEPELWDYIVHAPSLRAVLESRRDDLLRILDESGRFQAKRRRNALGCAARKYLKQSFLPLYVLKRLGIPVPKEGRLRAFKPGAHIWLPATLGLSDDLLWLIGFFIAEGCSHYSPEKSAFISFCSDSRLLDRAARILEGLGCHVVRAPASKTRGPSVTVHSKILHYLFKEVFGLIGEKKKFPVWVLQLPLSRLKHVLEGFREGDGTHSGKRVGKELCFDTISEPLAHQLLYLLLRFGIVGSFGKYNTTFRKKYGERRFPFFRVTVCELDDFNILKWDRGVRQTLNARRIGDLVWSRVEGIDACEPTAFVYDFSVPNKENFVAGNGVFCHNTYGPRMRKEDGRAIPNFISQALAGKPLTVFGDGSQTRSFCYVTDMVEGIRRLMESDLHEPVNIGNPNEMTLLELAKFIAERTGGKSRIVFRPLPKDDPKIRCPDIRLARQRLGWQPKVELEEGLRQTIDWFECLDREAELR